MNSIPTPTEAKMLQIVRENPGIHLSRAADMMGVSYNYAQNIVHCLRRRGLVTPSDRSGKINTTETGEKVPISGDEVHKAPSGWLRRRWTDEENAKLRQLWSWGVPIPRIAQQFNTSERCVKFQVKKLELPGRAGKIGGPSAAPLAPADDLPASSLDETFQAFLRVEFPSSTALLKFACERVAKTPHPEKVIALRAVLDAYLEEMDEPDSEPPSAPPSAPPPPKEKKEQKTAKVQKPLRLSQVVAPPKEKKWTAPEGNNQQPEIEIIDAIQAINDDGTLPTAQDLADGLELEMERVLFSIYIGQRQGTIQRVKADGGEARYRYLGDASKRA